MAGKIIGQIAKVAVTLPRLQFLLDDLGGLIGFQGPTGLLTMLPAGQSDNALTASTTQTQNGGLPLNYRNSRVTVGALNDAVTLPQAIAGMRMAVRNVSANSIGVFPALGDRINAAAVDAVFVLTTATTAEFTCFAAGEWATTS